MRIAVTAATVLTAVAVPALAAIAQGKPAQTAVRDASQPPYSAVGKLEVSYGGGEDGECTATALDTPSRSLVLTAGHCLRELVCAGCHPQRVARSEVFIPAYDHGHAPFGRFVGESWEVPRRWRGNNNKYDMGVISTAPNSRGEHVADAVGGGLKIAVDQPREQTYQLIGYTPAHPQRLRTCTGRFDGNDLSGKEPPGPAPFRINCFMGDGASGGPMLIDGGTAIDGMDTYSKAGKKAYLDVYSPYFSRRTIGALLARFER